MLPGHGLQMTSIQPEMSQQEETAMLEIDEYEYQTDLLEDYPEEVLESEWNPIVAQIQLLKRLRREVQQSPVSLWLSIPEMKYKD